MTLRLGRQKTTVDMRDLRFSSYLKALPALPSSFGHDDLVPVDTWNMLGNGPDNSVESGFQGAGDCVEAGADHEVLLWNAEADKIVTFSGKNTIDDYSKITGYVLDNASTDNGTQVRDCLNYRRTTGMLDAAGARHKIGAFVSIEPTNLDHIYEAAYIFGAVGLGINFPDSAEVQFNLGQPWSVVPGAKIIGGHYVPLVAKRSSAAAAKGCAWPLPPPTPPPGSDMLYCITWGKVQAMTPTFLSTYCEEAWGMLSEEMLKGGKSLEGFDLVQLQDDLNQL